VSPELESMASRGGGGYRGGFNRYGGGGFKGGFGGGRENKFGGGARKSFGEKRSFGGGSGGERTHKKFSDYS